MTVTIHGMSRHRLPLVLLAASVVLLLWPVRADASRYALEVRSGAQPLSQLETRWADPAQRPFLQRRPACGVPLLAPLFYMQDTALRRGCAGPNGRSMSLAALALLGAVVAMAARRPATDPLPTTPG